MSAQSGENRGRGATRSRSRSPFDRRNANQPSPHRKRNVTSAPSNLSPISSSGASSEGIPSPVLTPTSPLIRVTEPASIATQVLDLPTIEPRAKDRPSENSSPVAAPTLATVGIMSIGEMGLAIAKMLTANNYRIFTNLQGRRYFRVVPNVTRSSSVPSASAATVIQRISRLSISSPESYRVLYRTATCSCS